jgi:hypothetical protein
LGTVKIPGVLGVVQYPTGAVIPGAMVTVEQSETGFQPFSQTGVRLDAGASVTLNINFQVGGAMVCHPI